MNDLLVLEVGAEETTTAMDTAEAIVEEAFTAEPGTQPAPARMPEPGAEVVYEE